MCYDFPHMSRILRLLVVLLLVIVLVAGWVWWNRPTQVDMAAYVPADALLYLESNSLLDVAAAIGTTDTWQKLGPQAGIKLPQATNNWSTYLVKLTGLGSVNTVIATRAQVAFVMLDLTSAGNGDALEFKSEAALIIETHTSERRVRPAVESILNDFTARAYINPKFEHVNVENNDFLRWTSSDGQRKIIAAVDGTVVVVGNNEKAVAACLAARHGGRPSLLHRQELEETRGRLNGNTALAFGYVPSANAPHLISELAKIKFGPIAQGDQFQKFLRDASVRLVGTLGWSARATKGGIEDRYFVGLKPEVVSRIRPAFVSSPLNFQGAWELLPADVYSVTSYNIRNPAEAWDTFNIVVSSQLDVVSAMLFVNQFKDLLKPYGIEDPDAFLKAVKPDLLTVRMDQQSDRALLITGMANQETLRQYISRRFGAGSKVEKIGEADFSLSSDEEFAAGFAGDYFLLGAPEDVRHALTTRANRSSVVASPERLDALTHYFERPSSANIVTFSKDPDQVQSFITSLGSIRGSRPPDPSPEFARVIESLPYSVVESSFGDGGFERRTRSDFGQFGFLISFLAPQQSSSPTPSR